MSEWKVAPAIKALFTQADLQAPRRRKASDGTVSSQQHRRANPNSDHDPNERGWVLAGDLTDDDRAGIDCREIAAQIVARKDRRVKYLIHEGQICSGNTGPRPWAWRPYAGPNGHFKHLHISVLERWRSDTSPWWTTSATPDEEDEMTPEDRKLLKEVHAMLKAMTAPRRADRKDADPSTISLADVFSMAEAAERAAKR